MLGTGCVYLDYGVLLQTERELYDLLALGPRMALSNSVVFFPPTLAGLDTIPISTRGWKTLTCCPGRVFRTLLSTAGRSARSRMRSSAAPISTTNGRGGAMPGVRSSSRCSGTRAQPYTNTVLHRPIIITLAYDRLAGSGGRTTARRRPPTTRSQRACWGSATRWAT